MVYGIFNTWELGKWLAPLDYRLSTSSRYKLYIVILLYCGGWCYDVYLISEANLSISVFIIHQAEEKGPKMLKYGPNTAEHLTLKH